MKNSIFKRKVVQCKILKWKKLTLKTFCGKKLPFATRGTSVDNAGGWGDHSNLIFWNVLDWSWYQDVTYGCQMPSKNLDSSELRGNQDCRRFFRGVDVCTTHCVGYFIVDCSMKQGQYVAKFDMFVEQVESSWCRRTALASWRTS